MFNRTKTIIRQGEKIIQLEEAKESLEKSNKQLTKKNFDAHRECLNLQGMLDDVQDEILNILNTLEGILTQNPYGKPEIVIAKAVAEIKYQKKIIEDDKNIESDNDCDID